MKNKEDNDCEHDYMMFMPKGYSNEDGSIQNISGKDILICSKCADVYYRSVPEFVEIINA